jgi:transglutaminase-like putative cysteine protease
MARVVWAGLLLLTGAWSLSTAWSGAVSTVVFGVAAAGPLVLVAIGARLRLPVPLVAFALLLGSLAAGYRWAVPPGVAPATGLRDAVARLLTERSPAPATPDLLEPGVLLVIVVSIWVAMRTVRPLRQGFGLPAATRHSGPNPGPRRGAGLVAAPAGAIVLYTAAALLTAGRADPRGLVAGALVVVAAAGWFLLDAPRPAFGVAAARLVPSAALMALVALGFGLLWVGGPGFEPRRLVDLPGRTLAEPSPLPRIAAWLQQGDVELLRANVNPGAPLRLVVLSDYTGETWSATATYRRPGTGGDSHLPVAHETTVVAQVSIATLDGPWLPTPGRATQTSSSDVDIEPDAGSLALRSGDLRPGLTYSVRAVLDTPRVDELAAAAVPSGPSVSRVLDLPRLPREFTDYARQVTFGASTPFEQAVALEFAVREGARVDDTAPTGSSYARLDTFLFRPAGSEPGAHTGTSEQFAAAFAVLARAVGLPTRIVVGFASGTPGPNGTLVMRGRDAEAWPEVYFAGLGWYGFEPTPSANGGGGSDEQVKLNVLDRMGAQASRANPAPTPTGPTPAATTPPVARQAAAAKPAPSGQLAVSAAAALLVLLALMVAARWARRSRHRRAGDRGAWSEVVDLLVLMGRPPPPWRPAPEVAADLAGFAPVAIRGPATSVDVPFPRPHPAQVIASAADRATFAPATTAMPRVGRNQSLGADAWSALRELRRAVRRVVPLWRRLSWPVDPRPLLRRRRNGARRR